MVVTEERYDLDDAFDDELDDTLADDSLEEDIDYRRKPKQLSIWQKIGRFFFKSADQREEIYRTRLQALNQAVNSYPDAAVNYVLRGEVHLDLRLWDAAQQDFEQALTLAQEQYHEERWGLASQAIQDRAQRGLQAIRNQRNLI